MASAPNPVEIPYLVGKGSRSNKKVLEARAPASLKIRQDEMGDWEIEFARPELYLHWYYHPNKGWATKALRNTENLDLTRRAGRGDQSRPLYVHVPGRKAQVIKRVPAGEDAFEDVFYYADTFVHRYFPDAYKLKHKDAHWLTKEMSGPQEKQVARAAKAGVMLPPHLDRGRASDFIDAFNFGLVRAWRPGRTRRKALQAT